MTLYKGTIPSGPGDITVYRDESTDLFKSNRLVERVLLSNHGHYSLPLPKAGTYIVEVRTSTYHYPRFTVTATAGLTEAPLPALPTPTRRGAPVPVDSAATPSVSGGLLVDKQADELGAIQAQKLSRSWPDKSGGGLVHVFNGDEVTYEVTGGTTYRSESIWGVDNASTGKVDAIKSIRGDRLTVEFDYWLSPEFATLPANCHHVLCQFHGPQKSGAWPAPPVELVFQNGSYRISNAGSSPLPDGTLVPTFDEVHPRIWLPASQRVNTWHRWKISVLFAGSGCGSVDAWLDGTKIVEDWRPRPGTFYTLPASASGDSTHDHDWIYFKTGLYGYGSDAPKRTAKLKNLRITQRELNQVKTWYL